MSEDFLEREVLGRVHMDRRAFVKKLIIGAAFAAPAVASFDMLTSKPGYGVLSANGVSRQDIICQQKIALRDSLQATLTSLPTDAPAALKNRLQRRVDKLNAYIAAHSC